MQGAFVVRFRSYPPAPPSSFAGVAPTQAGGGAPCPVSPLASTQVHGREREAPAETGASSSLPVSVVPVFLLLPLSRQRRSGERKSPVSTPGGRPRWRLRAGDGG